MLIGTIVVALIIIVLTWHGNLHVAGHFFSPHEFLDCLCLSKTGISPTKKLFPGGDAILLIGPSGSGKTSLFHKAPHPPPSAHFPLYSHYVVFVFILTSFTYACAAHPWRNG
jgi:hypothetical protein